MKPIGIQLYTVRDLLKDDFFGSLRQIADIGYKGVEPAGLYGHKPSQVRKALDDLGLRACSAHMAFPTTANVNQLADEAHALGYDLLICGRGTEDFASPATISKAAGELEQAAALLKPHGLRLGYHNHWWEFDTCDGKIGMQRLLDAAASLAGQLDIYWATNFGCVDVPAFLAANRRRIPSLHIKDGPLEKGAHHTAAGAGRMDIASCIRAADPATLQWLIVELDSCATDMMTAVRDSYRYLTTNGLAEGNR